MNYIDLINRFWQEVEMKDFLPSEACVYFRLLDVCNKLGWQNPFSLSNARAVVLMATNEKTFRAVRDKLAARGLIEFRKGNRRSGAPLYCLPKKTDDGWIFDWGNFLPVKNPAKSSANNTAKSSANNTAKSTAKPSANTPAYNKTIDIDNIDDAVVAGARASDGFDEMLTAFFAPERQGTLEAFCMNLRIDMARLRSLAEEAIVGWRVNGRKRHISQEDAFKHLTNTIRIKLHDQKAYQRVYENNQTDRFSARRGAEPRNDDRKGYTKSF